MRKRHVENGFPRCWPYNPNSIMTLDFNPNLEPGFSVVVSTFDRPQAAAKLTGQLLDQQGLSYPLEILVVNDHGDQAVFGAIRELPAFSPTAVRFFDTGYAGYGLALARNAGLRFARYETILFLDDDVEVGCDLIQAYGRAPEGPRVGRVLFQVDGETYPDRRTVFQTVTRSQKIDQFFPHMGLLWGANCCVPTALAREIGGFDEAFLEEGEEDLDFSARIVSAAKTIVLVPEAVAIHQGPDNHLAQELGKETAPPRVGRASERFSKRDTLVVNGGMEYWQQDRWKAMAILEG